MTKILERVTEPAGAAKAFFIPPDRLLQAQECLARNGLSRTHCATLCNIEARWRHEPNKPISLRDISRLYGVSRSTAGKLLGVLEAEYGYRCERVFKESGADRGYVMRRAAAGSGELPGSTEKSREGGTCASGECNAGDRRVPPTLQGSATCVAPTRTSYKNPLQEPLQDKELSGSRSGARPLRVNWGSEEEEMTQAALDLFTRCQAQRGGAWELEPDDRQQLLEAAVRAHNASERGDSPFSLESRLADALNRAEAHAWAHGRPLPHAAAQHFGVHLRPEPFEAIKPVSEHGREANAHDEDFPGVVWCPDRREWLSGSADYCGATFAQADQDVTTPVTREPSPGGMTGLSLEAEKQRQIAALNAYLAVA